MREITDAVVLMAGTGSRLRASGELLPKPLVPILGRPLISYIAEAFEKVGVQTLHAIVGANGDSLVRSLRPLIPATMHLNPIRNPDWQKQNGLSVLYAAGHVADSLANMEAVRAFARSKSKPSRSSATWITPPALTT